MQKNIVQLGDKHLRVVSRQILEEEIKSTKFQKSLKDLKDTLDSADDGLAISAPQIGENMRVFIVSPKMFDEKYIAGNKKEWDKKIKHLVVINPKIISLSIDKDIKEEGCLSIRGVFGKVKRSTKAKIRALDENGKTFERGASGLLARVFQHEIDHLNGILFIDKAKVLNDENGKVIKLTK